MSETPELVDVIRGALDARAERIHTAFPARVQAYDAATQTADLLPTIRVPLRTESGRLVHEDLPVLPRVRVEFPRSRAFFMHFPLLPGDHVLVVVCERSFETWLRTARVSEPGDVRLHGLSGAVAVPGLFPDVDALDPADASTSEMTMGAVGGPQIAFGSTDVRLGSPTATALVALATLVDASITALQIAHDTHTHATAPTGPVSIPSTIAGAQASVAATKVRAE